MADPLYINPTVLFPSASNPRRTEPIERERCATQFEHDAALAMCGWKRKPIQGIGAAATYSDFAKTRWAEFDPCDVVNFAICDTQCNDEREQELIQQCRMGAPPAWWPPYDNSESRRFYFNNWCNQVGAGLIDNEACPTVRGPPPDDTFVTLPQPALPDVPIVEPPTEQRKAFAVGGLLLLLVAGAATAYYVSQRKGE